MGKQGLERDADALAMLRALGCDMAQGYYLSPPLTPGEFDGSTRPSTGLCAW